MIANDGPTYDRCSLRLPSELRQFPRFMGGVFCERKGTEVAMPVAGEKAVLAALRKFAGAVTAKMTTLTAGEPEDQLRVMNEVRTATANRSVRMPGYPAMPRKWLALVMKFFDGHWRLSGGRKIFPRGPLKWLRPPESPRLSIRET